MIKRYARKEMSALWTDESKFSKWLKVELAVLEELEARRIVPKGVASMIKKKAKINVHEIERLEVDLKHDVIAFTTSIANQCGDESRYFHYGLTSSDVVDTALAMLLSDSLHMIDNGLIKLSHTLLKMAEKTKNIPAIGRTHGMHAEPTSFGLRFLAWYSEFNRHRERLSTARDRMAVGKLSGAVGAYGVLTPEIEAAALKKLGLGVETVSTQVLPRDRHAEVFQVLAGIASTIDKVATELRHLQRTEVDEAQEGFSGGQKGSSAMPHKRNPISSENLSGCARVMRGYAQTALENVSLWHERDISHSSAERVICPDATILMDYMIDRLTRVVNGLEVKRDSIQKNLKISGEVYFSGHVLLALVQKGMLREDAYKVVQSAAHRALDRNTSFRKEFEKESACKENFNRAELNALMDVRRYLKHVDKIFVRAKKDAFK